MRVCDNNEDTIPPEEKIHIWMTKRKRQPSIVFLVFLYEYFVQVSK